MMTPADAVAVLLVIAVSLLAAAVIRIHRRLQVLERLEARRYGWPPMPRPIAPPPKPPPGRPS